MKTTLVCFAVFLMLGFGPGFIREAEAQEPAPRDTACGGSYLAHSVKAAVLGADPESVSEEVAEWIESKGGYYLFRSEGSISARLPDSRLPALRSFLEESSEGVTEYSPSARDVREEILYLRAAVSGREEILEKNMTFLEETGFGATLAVERELMEILTELEGLEGRLRRLEHERRYALLDVQINFLEQDLPSDIPSSFEWVNSVDFYSFIRGTR
ncbi:MAG: DUF4349 domain-containing protein [Spirochaetota bacterium]